MFRPINDQSLVRHNVSISADNAGPRDADGLPLNCTRGGSFGTATAITHFPQAATTPAGAALYARTFMMSFGLRL